VRRVLTLAIEASNPSAVEPGQSVGTPGVAIGETVDGVPRVLGVELIALDRRHDDDLIPAIDRLMRRLSVRPREFGRIAVSVGPGGFTGLRVSIASAKMIAEAVGARCVAVPSAHVVARHAVSGVGTLKLAGPFVVALASKAEDTFVTLFDAGGEKISRGGVMDVAQVSALVGGSGSVRLFVADRFLPASIRAMLAAQNVPVLGPLFEPACCFEASLGLPEIDPIDLLPLYPREPEAVRKWRELHGR